MCPEQIDIQVIRVRHTSRSFSNWKAAFPFAIFLFCPNPSPLNRVSSSCTLSSAKTVSPLVRQLSLIKNPRESHNKINSRRGGSSSLSGVTIGDNIGLKTLHTSSKLSLLSINIAPAILSNKSPSACNKHTVFKREEDRGEKWTLAASIKMYDN